MPAQHIHSEINTLEQLSVTLESLVPGAKVVCSSPSNDIKNYGAGIVAPNFFIGNLFTQETGEIRFENSEYLMLTLPKQGHFFVKNRNKESMANSKAAGLLTFPAERIIYKAGCKMVNDYIVFIHENEIKSVLEKNYIVPQLSNKVMEVPWLSEKTGSMFQFIQSAINITNNFPTVRNSLFVENNLKEITSLMLSELVAEKLKLKSIAKHNASKLLLTTAQEIIEAECETLFTVHDMASRLNTGVRNLQLAFKKYDSTTPMQFLRDRKLEKARANLLSNNNPLCTVKEVALQVGIFDLSRFSKTYFNKFGELPNTTLKRNV